jgi:glycosyltransferase involved in cell wall biosynthesis
MSGGEAKQVGLSVVVPVYGCRECLVELHRRLDAALQGIGMDYELILVDDSSPDGAWEAIAELCRADARVKGIRLSRNFGQHQAISAGLDQALGSWVVVMDCDLQDDPAEIPRFHQKAAEGYDAVVGRRAFRQDSWFRRGASRAFYALLGYLTESKIDASVANFGIYSARLIRAVKSMGDDSRFFPLMVRWVGFRVASIEVNHQERHSGRTSYSWARLLSLALNAALSFSSKPLKVIVSAGFCISALAFAYACRIFFMAAVFGIPVLGWSSVIISIWFLSGVQMIVVGLVGIYVGKIFEASKRRPLYLVSQSLNVGGREDTL